MIEYLDKRTGENTSCEERLGNDCMCINIDISSQEPDEDIKEDDTIDKELEHLSTLEYPVSLGTIWYTHGNINRGRSKRNNIKPPLPKVIDLISDECNMNVHFDWCFAFNE